MSPRAHVSRVPRQPRPAPECRGSAALVAVWRRSSAHRAAGALLSLSPLPTGIKNSSGAAAAQSRATQPSMSTVAAPGPALAPAPAPGTDTSQMFNLKWRNYQHHMLAVFDKAWAH